jgi:hypothetical protein
MSLLSTLETIGKDIQAGIAAAEPIVEGFSPTIATILQDVSNVIGALEAAGTSVTSTSSAAISSIVQATAMTSVVKQWSAKKSAGFKL